LPSGDGRPNVLVVTGPEGVDGGRSYIVSGDDASHYTPAPD
jgi:hypothetical protein